MNRNFSLNNILIDKTRRSIELLVNEAYDNATEHGFTGMCEDLVAAVPVEQRRAMQRTVLLSKLALIGSEVGEAVRALQHGDDRGFAEEIADVVIRVMDLCGYTNIDLGDEIIQKMQANRKRPVLHGKEC